MGGAASATSTGRPVERPARPSRPFVRAFVRAFVRSSVRSSVRPFVRSLSSPVLSCLFRRSVQRSRFERSTFRSLFLVLSSLFFVRLPARRTLNCVNVLSVCFTSPSALVSAVVCRADAAAASRVAGDCQRQVDADPRADGDRQDARGVSGVSRSGHVQARAGSTRAVSDRLHFAVEGAGGGRRAQPAGTAGRDLERRARAGRSVPHADDLAADRRHAILRTRPLPPRSGRHPDHHARVALPHAHLGRPRSAAQRRDRDHRRDPRAGVDQARRTHGAVARTARTVVRRTAAAHRAVGDAEAVGRSCAIYGW